MAHLFRKIFFINIILVVLLGGLTWVTSVKAFDDIEANFTAEPTSGIAPLAVQFTDQSTVDPTGWAWYFGDEDFSADWSEATSGAAWSARSGHSSVVTPDGSILLMGGHDGSGYKNDVWRSTDGGVNWEQVTAGADWSGRLGHSSVVLLDGSIVLMGGDDGIFRNDVWHSTDGGVNWTQVNANPGWAARVLHSSVVTPDGSIVLMGGVGASFSVKNDVWRSDDKGVTWIELTGSAGWAIRYGHTSVVTPDGGIVLMGGADGTWGLGTKNDAWRSTDGGVNWTEATAEADWSRRARHSSVVLPDGSIVLMGGYAASGYKNDVWHSDDNGASWTILTGTVGWSGRYSHTSVLTPDGSIVLMGGTAGSVIRKNDVWRMETAGSHQQHPQHTYTEPGIYSVTLQAYKTTAFDRIIKTGMINVRAIPVQAGFTATPTSGVSPLSVDFDDTSSGDPTGWAWYFGDEDFSADWTQPAASAGWPARFDHSSVVLLDGSILLMGGTHSYLSLINDVWRSTDGGVNWEQVTAGADWSRRSGHSSVVLPDGSILLMGGYAASGNRNDVWRSINNGATWYQVTASAEWIPRSSHTSVVTPDGSILLMGGFADGGYKNDVWRSDDKGATWYQVIASAEWLARARHSSVVTPDGSIVLMGGDEGGTFKNDVWRSVNNGATWTQVAGSAAWSVRASHSSVVLPDGSILLMGGYAGSSYKNDVWHSDDNGVTWKALTGTVGWDARYAHTSVVTPDGTVVLMGGFDSSYQRKDDIWHLETAGSNLPNPQYTYTELGIYSVTLQAYKTAASGRVSKPDHIHVQKNVVADFSASQIGGMLSQTFNFTNQSLGDFDTCEWNFGDGNTSAECSDTSHTYDSPGNYTVSLTVSGSGGMDTKIRTDYVTVLHYFIFPLFHR